MIKFYKGLPVFLLVAALQPCFAQQIKIKAGVKHALSVVQPDEIKADIAYLADDKLKGRMPGTEGYQMAVDYVVGRLKSLNVKPAGENHTWLQKVNLRKATTANNPVISITNSTDTLAVGKNISILPNPQLADVEAEGQLVFAGYGVSEPKLGYDDYAGIDAKGKIVVIVRGSPDQFSSSVAAHVMNPTTMLKTAAQHGAIGVIVASTDSTAKMSPTPRRTYSVMGTDGKVAISGSYWPEVKLLATIDYKLLRNLLQQSGKNVQDILPQLKAGKPQSNNLKAGIKASFHSAYEDILSYNVVGKIAGSDPKLKYQYVVHSAHLDHLGIGAPVQGDSIYNGAHDNASGVASLLGIAKVYAHLKVKPKRSILVVMVTGEEMGDLGSGYFASHPTVPLKSMVADVNTDMPTIIAPLLSITALGAEHSSLSKQVDEAAGYLGISVEPDPEPKQARFTRSDQYSFVVNGIPALHVKYGNKTADGKNNLSEIVAPWRAKYYHKPQDDINGVFDFEAGKRYAQLNFLIGYLIAQDNNRPTWNAGDIFAGPDK